MSENVWALCWRYSVLSDPLSWQAGLKQSSTRKHLQDLILIHNKRRLWGDLTGLPPSMYVNFATWGTMDIKSFPFSLGLICCWFIYEIVHNLPECHKSFAWRQKNMDWEEVVRFAIYTELQAATLVFVIDDRKWPFQDVFPAVMVILPIQITDHRSTDTWPTWSQKTEVVYGYGLWCLCVFC